MRKRGPMMRRLEARPKLPRLTSRTASGFGFGFRVSIKWFEFRVPDVRVQVVQFRAYVLCYRGGLVFEAHRLLYHSALGSRTF